MGLVPYPAWMRPLRWLSFIGPVVAVAIIELVSDGLLDGVLFGDLPSMLISSSNLAVARPLFWLSLGLFALSAGAMFVRAVLQIRDPRPAAGEVPGGAD